MKTKILTFIIIAAFTACSAFAQGTMFVYDQQSSTDETPFPGVGNDIQSAIGPWGQSFTPLLSSIDFIRLKFADGNAGDGAGATIYLNLHAGSLTGALRGTTAQVTMPNNFAGTTTFLFPSSISLTPGTTYYFEPVLVGSANWKINAGEYSYPGGSLIAGGLPQPSSDLWFREGVVPEPSSFALLMLCGAGLYVHRSRCSKNP